MDCCNFLHPLELLSRTPDIQFVSVHTPLECRGAEFYFRQDILWTYFTLQFHVELLMRRTESSPDTSPKTTDTFVLVVIHFSRHRFKPDP